PEHAEGIRLALGDRALVSTHSGQVVALLETPRTVRDRAELEHALRGRRAWIGPPRAWELVSESHRVATLAQSLRASHTPASDDPKWVEEHIAQIIITSEPEMVADLA